MATLKDLLGETLKKTNGDVVSVETLNGPDKVVGLFFSAHWCPPCRAFTPKLVEFYNNLKKSVKGGIFEIIFVSSDKDESSFQEYFSWMPWLALPFEDRDRKARLSAKYKISGVPSFILLDAETCTVITEKGRDNVEADPEGAEFPWYPKSIRELLKGKLIKPGGHTTDESAFKGKFLGLYFSADWCPPGRAFTPKLIETYKKMKQDGKQFEIIYISRDTDEESFKESFSTMPWLSLAFDDRRGITLSREFEIEGIPTLVLLDEDLKMITNKAIGYAEADPEGKEFPWGPKPVEKLTEMVVNNVYEMACMMLFTRGDEEWSNKAVELMKDTAEGYKVLMDRDPELKGLCFMYEGKESDKIADSLMKFTRLEERFPQLVIIDFNAQKKYIHLDSNITKNVVQKLADDFRTGKLEMIALQH